MFLKDPDLNDPNRPEPTGSGSATLIPSINILYRVNQCCGSSPFLSDPVLKIRIRIWVTQKRPDPTRSWSYLNMFLMFSKIHICYGIFWLNLNILWHLKVQDKKIIRTKLQFRQFYITRKFVVLLIKDPTGSGSGSGSRSATLVSTAHFDNHTAFTVQLNTWTCCDQESEKRNGTFSMQGLSSVTDNFKILITPSFLKISKLNTKLIKD